MYTERNSSNNSTASCTFNVSLFLRYAGTSVVVFGLLGNFLSILVFSRKTLRSRSCSIYFLALSVSDVHVLLGYTIETLLSYGFNIQLLSYPLMCKLIIFLIYASTDISNYLLTLAAIDRCILVSNYSVRFRFCRKSTAKLTVLIVVLVFSLINSHILIGFHVDETGSCLLMNTTYSSFYTNYYDSYIDIIKTVLLPFLIIFICNIFIIIKYTRRIHFSMAKISSKRKSRRRREKDRQLTWFLLSTSILFILLSLPSEINDFIRPHLSSNFQNIYSCQILTCATMLILIHQINHASHFYVYTLTGPIFRKEFQRLICLSPKQPRKKDFLIHLQQPSLTLNVSPQYDLDIHQVNNSHIPHSSNSSAYVSF
ncbi:unnamed protein product [Adineta ricciae]|uniref:G-protein coupled receptors family 1 profile domain-containing protein n=1 Tax=Adineta ricciae TaxID=249248 RepID=A0A813YBM9_ADIRI|nr:unnamed protein product [Adineta ricciae]CAF0963701.1 unnamed protein product [Adineta ricciae]